MAKPSLTNEQREALLTWLAAGYDGRLILVWAKEREWPALTRQAISYYRVKEHAAIDAARIERHAAALNSGLALQAERVARLQAHADQLEAIKWVTDKNGRCWNEKAWRETLDEIAQETGGRVRKIAPTTPDGSAPYTPPLFTEVVVMLKHESLAD
jgi:hypothetical protein